jgi:hypothetical protein
MCCDLAALYPPSSIKLHDVLSITPGCFVTCCTCLNLQPGRKLTEQEAWEAKQLRASGVVTVDELPQYDNETGMEVLRAQWFHWLKPNSEASAG